MPNIAIPALFIALISLFFPYDVAAQQHLSVNRPPSPLLKADARLGTLAYRLTSANARLCRQLAPAWGAVLHSRDQYGEGGAMAALFPAGTDLAVAAVAPGSPADLAGLRPGDALVAIGQTGPEAWRSFGYTPLRDGAYEAVYSFDTPFEVSLVRQGEVLSLAIDAPPGCRSLVEVTTESGLAARADGRVIQLSYELVALATDDELAVILAHEIAHQVLEHRNRLDRAGVRKGFFGQFGDNLAANAAAEREADRLSVHLLANTGMDPAIAPRFWSGKLGERLGGGLFRNRIYASPRDRAAVLEQEIARYLPGGIGPSYPGHLLAWRDAPIPAR